MDEFKDVSLDRGTRVALHVSNLSCRPKKNTLRETYQKVQHSAIVKQMFLPEIKDTFLRRVEFHAHGGEFVGILGSKDERNELIHLLAGQKKSGEFDGDISLSGSEISAENDYYSKVAFASQEPANITGLTYCDSISFAAQLKMRSKGDDAAVAVHSRVEDLLTTMKLLHCRDRKMSIGTSWPEGREASELQRMHIACEIADLPPVIIVDEPTHGFDSTTAMIVLDCLKSLANRGHLVICSMTNPFVQEYELFDRVVLLSHGYSVYAGKPANCLEFFTSPYPDVSANNGGTLTFKYDKVDASKSTNLVDFIGRVLEGHVKPGSEGTVSSPTAIASLLQQKFEHCKRFLAYTNVQIPENKVNAFTPSFFAWYGYGRCHDSNTFLHQTWTILKRNWYARYCDTERNLTQLSPCISAGIVIGYIQMNAGDHGLYANSLVDFPYTYTSNLCAILFCSSLLTWAYPYIGLFQICRQVKMYWHDRAHGYGSSLMQYLTFCVADIPINVFCITIFCNILYFMTDLKKGYDNYFFFMFVVNLLSIVGLVGAYVFAILFNGNPVFVIWGLLTATTFAALLSGFVCLLPNMNMDVLHSAALSPIRWSFEGLMAWRFENYYDGQTLLTSFDFESFQHNHSLAIMGNFILFLSLAAVVFGVKSPNCLTRNAATSGSTIITGNVPATEETTSNLHTADTAAAEKEIALADPVSNVSSLPEDPVLVSEGVTPGSTVTLKHVSHRVVDFHTSNGYKQVLQDITASFRGGRMHVLLGGPASGKTTLLHMLANSIAVGAEVSGEIKFDGLLPDPKEPQWHRCSFVPAETAFLPEFTVHHVLMFALKFRGCLVNFNSPEILQHIKNVLAIVHLPGDKICRLLTKGEAKRLAIAEEVVGQSYQGRKVLLLDEPLKGLDMSESFLVLDILQTLVKKEGYTVITSLGYTGGDILPMFDSLVLLRQGHIIYAGASKSAVEFFLKSPYGYEQSFNKHYENSSYHAIEFLIDIASPSVPDAKVEVVEVAILETNYKNSPFYREQVSSLSVATPRVTSLDVGNPLANPTNPVANEQTNGDERTDDADSVVYQRRAAQDKSICGYHYYPWVLKLFLQFFYETFFLHQSGQGWVEFFLRVFILFQRSFFAAIVHWWMFVRNIVLHTGMGILFGGIMDDSSGLFGIYNTISFTAVGALFLLITNFMLGIYTHHLQLTYFKEYDRGLYSVFMKWLTFDIPSYVAHGINGVIFAAICWTLSNQPQDTDMYNYTLLTFFAFSICTTIMVECFINLFKNFFIVCAGIAFLGATNFVFSGLFIKPSTLPSWLRPWTPSISVLRWNMQTNFINIYKDANTIFFTLPSGYTTYSQFCQLFGWGGKTKEFCFSMILVCMLVYKVASLVTNVMGSVSRKGGR